MHVCKHTHTHNTLFNQHIHCQALKCQWNTVYEAAMAKQADINI